MENDIKEKGVRVADSRMLEQQKGFFEKMYHTTRWSGKGGVQEQFSIDYKKCDTQDDIIALYNKYIPYIWLGRSIFTVKNKYTDFKNIIKEIANKRQEKFALEVFYGGENLYVALKEDTEKKAEELLDKERKPIDIAEFEKDILELKNTIDSRSYKIARNQKEELVRAYYIAILLAFATGRRQIEILKTLDISGVKKVVFKGLAKKRNDDDNEIDNAHILFLGVSDTKKYLKELRKLLDTEKMTNKEINQKYNNVFNKAVERYTDFDMSFHDIRSAYAEICYSKFGEGEDLEKFYSKVLGHKVKAVTQATFYRKYSSK